MDESFRVSQSKGNRSWVIAGFSMFICSASRVVGTTGLLQTLTQANQEVGTNEKFKLLIGYIPVNNIR